MTNIKYPVQPALGTDVNSFPKTQQAKIKEMIDAINNNTNGALDDITPPSGNLSIHGSGDIYSIDVTTEMHSRNVVCDKVNVTQTGSITTGVTCNGGTGIITTVALTTAGGSQSGPFTVTNNLVESTSTIFLTVQYASGKTGNPIALVESVSNGSFSIKIGNGAPAATALNDVVKIHYLVI